MSGFDYPHTCGTIDSGLDNMKDCISSMVENIFCIYAEEDRHTEDNMLPFTERLYRDIKYIFEDVRKSNTDMRNAAEKQIAFLEEHISELLDLVSRKDRQIEDLDEQLDDLLN